MGYLDLKPVPAAASRPLSSNANVLPNGASSQPEMGSRNASAGNLLSDSVNVGRDPRRTDGNVER